MPRGHRRRPLPLEIPLLLLVAAFLLATAFRTERLVQGRIDLSAMHDRQERAVRDGRKVRRQLELLAGETARLAHAGNPHAAAVVQTMQRLGVTLKPKG